MDAYKPKTEEIAPNTFIPLTESQMVMWVGQKLDPFNPAYNSTIVYTIQEAIDPDIFQDAFQTVVNQRDSFRTVFEEVDGIPQTRILPHRTYQVVYLDFTQAPDPHSAVRAWVEKNAKTAFALEQCLFKCALLKKSADEFIWYMGQHHIITDGWSQQEVFYDVSRVYRQLIEKNEDTHAPTPQFIDYVSFEKKYRESPRFVKDRGYWEEHLLNNAEPLNFYGQPPSRQSSPVRRISQSTGPQMIGKIDHLLKSSDQESGSADALKFNFFICAYAVYLALISGKKTFNIGIPVHNRREKEFKHVTGLMVRLLPIRIEIADQDTIFSLMKKIKRTVLKAMQHGQYFIPNSLQNPVYDVLLNYHMWQGSRFYNGPVRVEWAHPGHAYGSMALQIHDFGRGSSQESHDITVDLEFSTEIFNAAMSAQAARHFMRVLEQCAANGDLPIAGITLFSDEEKQKILTEWNDTRSMLPDTRVQQIIEQQVKATPQATAVTFENRSLTYDQLNAQANQLAHALRKKGVGPDVLVGVCLERSAEMVVALLAVLKSAGAYVPLDPEYPRDRLEFMLADSDVPVLITQAKFTDRLSAFRARRPDLQILVVEDEWPALNAQPADNPPCQNSAEHLAYMIYTSGSTGKPKGAMNTHIGLLNRLLWMQKEYQLTAGDVVLQKTPFSFDVSVWEFFWPLMFGARLVVAKPGGHQDSLYLKNLIIQEKITTLHFVPSMLQIFLEENLETVGSLRRVICSGEALSVDTQKKFFKRVNAGLHNLYGPTEAAIDVTYWACHPDNELKSVPIGRPVSNTQIYILDPALNLQPVGMPGELHIGGIQLARGYHNRPELTAEKFIPDPFSQIPNGRLYKTGDLARFLPDGNVEYLGRLDHQVKIRGFRIELGEIESVFNQHPGLQSVAVIARMDLGPHAQLAAYLVMDAERPSVAEWRRFLTQQLPEYMVPSHYVYVDALPLSPNGKLDRKALPSPESFRPVVTQEYTAPQTDIQMQLAVICQEVLRKDRIGIHDNFFELGGDSLQAMQVVARVRNTFGTELPFRTFFESPTIAQMSQAIESNKYVMDQLSLTPVSRDQKIPLSSSQIRLWFLNEFDKNGATYNMPIAFKVDGDIDLAVLQRVIDKIVGRHESLRTTFDAADGQPYQIIRQHRPVPVEHISLCDLPGESRTDAAQKLADDEANTPFDLKDGPLFRVKVIALGPRQHVLLLTMHHIISDGWSVGIIAKEMTELYRSYIAGDPVELAPLPLQYPDFAYWQRQWLQGDFLKSQINYWREQLKGAPPLLELPLDFARPAVESFRGKVFHFNLDAELCRQARILSQRQGVTFFMTLQAVFVMLLSRYSGQEDIVIGTPIANRHTRDLESIVGFFVNTLVLRTDVSANPTFPELLKRVRRTNLEAYDHPHVPFEQLIQELNPQRNLSHSPWFQVMFVLQNTPLEMSPLEDLKLTLLNQENLTAKFDLILEFVEQTDGLFGTIQFNTDLFKPETIERLARHYTQLLEQLIADPDKNINEYTLLDQKEAERISDHLRQPPDRSASTRCLHELFEEQVRLQPHKMAVIAENGEWTYGQLNERANQLASILRKSGAARQHVGICVDRSIEMIAGVLGILKAGGVYVPMDPSYPQTRLDSIIHDAGLKCLLTQKKFAQQFTAGQLPVILLDDAARFEQEDKLDAKSAVQPDHCAYIIYTSGTTGRPKGVMVEHRALVNYIHAATKMYGVTAHDRILQFSALSFDAAAEEIYLALMNGGTLVLRSDDMISSARAFFDRCGHWGITVLGIPTAYWHQLVTDMGEQHIPGLPEALRTIVIGGERVLPAKVEQWFEWEGKRPVLINSYGPTETTVVATAKRLEKKDALNGEIPIGRPLDNVTSVVLDPYLQPVPQGVPGELYIGGAGLARGYWNDPALTEKKFIEWAHDKRAAVRLYKTGDRVRCLPDGNIQFLGRKDLQVKIRGFRIELEEIESVLAQAPAVKQAAVIIKEEESGEKFLAAFIAADTVEKDVSSIKEFIKQRLPAYMVPVSIVVLPALPVTVSGKYDRGALQRMALQKRNRGNDYVAPRDSIEKKLAEIWAEVLKAERVGIKDDFFDLGGHSLLAVVLAARVKKYFNVEISLVTLFQDPTVENLARLIRRRHDADLTSPLIKIQDKGNKSPFFCVLPVGGSVLLYRDLAQAIGDDQDFYAFQPIGLDQADKPFHTIEEIAGFYLTFLRTVQPAGPYKLGGWSIGGIIALEMARQLQTQGEPVSILVMIDSHFCLPHQRKMADKIISDDTALIVAMSRELSKVLGENIKYSISKLRSMSKEEQLSYIFEQACRENLLPEGVEPTYFNRLFEMYKANVHAFFQYRLQTYPGRAVLFSSEKGDQSFFGNSAGEWKKFIPAMDFHTIPGNHYTMLQKPNIHILAHLMCGYFKSNPVVPKKNRITAEVVARQSQ